MAAGRFDDHPELAVEANPIGRTLDFDMLDFDTLDFDTLVHELAEWYEQVCQVFGAERGKIYGTFGSKRASKQ